MSRPSSKSARWEGNVGELRTTVLLACSLGSLREALGTAAKSA